MYIYSAVSQHLIDPIDTTKKYILQFSKIYKSRATLCCGSISINSARKLKLVNQINKQEMYHTVLALKTKNKNKKQKTKKTKKQKNKNKNTIIHNYDIIIHEAKFHK